MFKVTVKSRASTSKIENFAHAQSGLSGRLYPCITSWFVSGLFTSGGSPYSDKRSERLRLCVRCLPRPSDLDCSFSSDARGALKTCRRPLLSTRSSPPSWRYWPTRRWRRSASSWTADTRCYSWRSRGAAKRTRCCGESCGSWSSEPPA